MDSLCVQTMEEQYLMPFEKFSAISPMCYSDNNSDERKLPEGNSTQRQRQRARMWDRMKDTEECLIELAGDNGAELKAELRYVGGCMCGLCVAIVAGACLYTC
jgi:hypothetical protein